MRLHAIRSVCVARPGIRVASLEGERYTIQKHKGEFCSSRDFHFWDLGTCMPQVTRSRWVLQAKRVDSGITDRLVNQRPMEVRNSASTINAISGASKNRTI